MNPMAIRLYKHCLVAASLLLMTLAGLNAQTVTFTPTQVTCNGAADATMKMDLTGGTSTYWYVCYNMAFPALSDSIGPTTISTYTFTNLSPNILYVFYVRDDATGDYVNFLGTIFSQPNVLNASVTSTNVTCYGGSTGTITIGGASGGSGLYDYTINGGTSWQSSGNYTGLSAGNYDVQIRDRNAPGCVKILNATYPISQPQELNATVTRTNVTCYNKNNGTIVISSPVGGSGTYQYSRNGGINWQASATFNAVPPGTYSVVMRDQGVPTCTKSLGSVTITQPAQLKVDDITILKGLTCNESSDGRLQAVVSGGTAPYTYAWYVNQSGSWVALGQTTATANNLPKGWYEVRVNDVNSCGIVTGGEYFLEGFTDSIPKLFVIDSASVVNTCAGQTNGTVEIHVHGGVKPYRFSIIAGGSGSYQPDSLFSGLSAGNYQTWAMDKKGCKKQGPSRTVAATPNSPVSASIAANPSGAICPGTSVLFTATPVNGGTAPAYQWQLNGVNVGTGGPTYTNSTLVNGNQVRVILTSSLRCTSGNPATSNTITASLLIPPSISVHPASASRCTGASVTFSVTAAGSGITYQWRKNGTNIGSATGSTYTIASVAAGDAANYDVVVTGTCGTVTSNAATLTVNTAPAITTQPVSTQACIGSPASFTVVATGTGLNYQWRKGGSNITGATSATYTIASVAAGDAGNYDVVITGTCGMTTSATVTLTVNTAPAITVQPSPTSACIGTPASFTVAATGTGLTYQWRKGGTNITGATAATYTIASVVAGDAANYDVVITGTCGTVTSNAAALTVNTAPAITTQPSPAAACIGSPASFTVAATGTGLAYQWRKGGAPIAGANTATYTIPSVVAGSAGNYDVVITGTCGSVTSNAVALTVNTAPAITTQPSPTSACTGTPASFTVAATGTGLTYQWRKGGTNITGANAATYTIPSVTAGSAGNYDVVITGTCGNITSNTVALTVNTAPAITTQPVPASACIGSPASFTVAATGTGLTYQWRKGGTNITAATAATYSILAVAAGDAANYDVVITGTCGTVTSNAVALTVNTPPAVTTQPANTQACTGSPASFSVVATGTGLNYQWRKGGTNITGATSATYTIPAVVAGDAGNYDVVITGTCGTLTSASASLTVNTAPAITTQPANTQACVGNPASFSIVATGTGLAYQWRKGGTNITGANAATYTIGSVTAGDAASYDVVITGTCGTLASATATLTVNTPPVITVQPVAQNPCEGTTAVFSVTATGTGLSYQWRRNGLNISGANNSTLMLTGITPLNAGNYDVIINGTCGSVTSNVAALTVAFNPVITVQPVDQPPVCEGSDVSFSVTATGTNLTYQWRKDGTNLTGQTAATLSLTAVIPSQSGNYDVVITGKCGIITSNAAVLIVDPATAVVDSDDDTLVCEGGIVDFNIVANGQGAVTYQWQREISGTWIDISDDADVSGVTTPDLRIQNVEIADTGYYRCFVSSACGSAYSTPVMLEMNQIIATIGTPAPFLINSATTEIVVGVHVTQRLLFWDLGISLVAPDGTEVMLKAPNPTLCGGNPYNKEVNVTFTTEIDKASGDTINWCVLPKLISGDFAATGDWSVLNGMDPANGAWQVRVYDSYNASAIYDGYLKLATLSFTDRNNNGDTVTVNYNSGAINEEILNPIAGELRATSYVVPIRLMTTCSDTEDARAVVTVQGGIPPFTYAWTGPTAVPAVADVLLGPGTYSVLVTDALGCSAVATVDVTAPPEIVFDDLQHTDTLACFNSNAGVIRSKASGGTGTLTYTLLPGNVPSAVADSGVFLNLAAGAYTIRVTDINDCTFDTIIHIYTQPELVVQVVIVPVIGTNPGSITLTASGGTPPYQYSIDNGTTLQPTGQFNNLPAGIYPVYVIDANGCIYTEDVNLTVNELNVTVDKNDVSCYGLADGSFYLATTDGVGPYTLTASWLSVPQTETSGLFAYTGQTAGVYDIRIEDSQGWLFIDTVEILEPAAIVATGIVTNATCSALTYDGAIDLTVIGGSGTFTFDWSNGAITEDLSNVEAGVYRVVVADENGCNSESYEFDIVGINVATAYAGENDTICPGSEYQLIGSVGDSVHWESDAPIDNPDIYNPTTTVDTRTPFYYTVYDNGCMDRDTVVIDVFERIGMDIYDPTGHVDIDTALFLLEGERYTMAATPGFASYLWQPAMYLDDPTLQAVVITATNPGYYTVFGTTDKGCVETDMVHVVIARPIEIYSGFSPNGDGINDTWVITNAVQYGDRINVKVFNRWGELVFESKGYGGSQEWDGTRNGTLMPVGAYYYIIDVNDGQSEPYTGTVTILR